MLVKFKIAEAMQQNVTLRNVWQSWPLPPNFTSQPHPPGQLRTRLCIREARKATKKIILIGVYSFTEANLKSSSMRSFLILFACVMRRLRCCLPARLPPAHSGVHGPICWAIKVETPNRQFPFFQLCRFFPGNPFR